MSQTELLDDLQLWISEREGKIPIEVLYLPRPANDYKGCYACNYYAFRYDRDRSSRIYPSL